jgi:hypothetical protein
VADVVAAGDVRQRFIASIASRDGFAALVRRALAAPMAASVFNRSRVERASRVTTTISPSSQFSQQPRQLLAVRPCAVDLFLKDALATGRLEFRHLRSQ